MITARPYQLEGQAFLTQNKRAMLADQPGLGKTLQAAEAASTSQTIGISCPTYLTDQWFEFLAEQYPNDAIVLCNGTRAQRQKGLSLRAKWYVFNHEMLRANANASKDLHYKFPDFDTIIFDESHHLRNRDAKQSQVAASIAHTTPNVYLLTGTPIVKDPDDMWHQLHMIAPDDFPSYWDFIYDHFRCSSSRFGTQIVGYKNKANFKAAIEPYVLGRSYKDVGLYLPSLIRSTIRVNLTPKIRQAYNDIRDYYAHEDVVLDNAMQVLHSLRFLTSADENKIRSVVDLAMEHPQFVVFCEYRDSAKRLSSLLQATLINGDIKPAERKTIAQSSPRIVATIDSLSEGVDLSHLHTCIFFEEDYTFGVMDQAMRRVLRWSDSNQSTGQPVLAYYVHAKDSVDEIIHKKQTQRTANASDIVKAELARAKSK